MNTHPVRATMIWLAGPIVWAAHFFLLYGITTAVCTRADLSRTEQLRWLSLILTMLALASLLGLAVYQIRAGVERVGNDSGVSTFLRMTMIALIVLAVIGIVWTASGAILLSTCATASPAGFPAAESHAWASMSPAASVANGPQSKTARL